MQWSSVCGYSFQSQGDKWGPDSRHVANDGPTEYMLQGSVDRINWEVLHYQNCGPQWGEMQHIGLSLEQQLQQQQVEQEKLVHTQRQLHMKKGSKQQQQLQTFSYSGPPLGTGAFQHDQAVSEDQLTSRLSGLGQSQSQFSFLASPEIGSSVQDVCHAADMVPDWGGQASGYGSRLTWCWFRRE